MSIKKVIYTAIIDDYDTVETPKHINPNYKYILFTNMNIDSDFWEVRKVKGEGVKLARNIKIRPDIYLPEFEFSIWVDANIIPYKSLDFIVDEMVGVDMITMQHPSRNCIYQEMNACNKIGKDSMETMSKQIERYKENKYPVQNGLIASGLIFRWHNLNVKKLMKHWDYEVQNYSHRDQLSFNYCLEQNPIKLGLVPFSLLNTHFIYKRHK